MIVFRLRCFSLLTTNYDCTVGTSRYALIDVVGRGAYGVVCAARDELGGSGSESLVAIKKINNPNKHVNVANLLTKCGPQQYFEIGIPLGAKAWGPGGRAFW